MPTVPASGRADLGDAQWAVLEPLLPRGKKPGRPRTWTRRQLIDGIRWRTRTGSPWRDVPERYGPWQSVYGLFRRWQRDGTWSEILTALQARADAAGLITWDVSVDSTVAVRTSTPPARVKGGSPARAARRRRRRARRSRAGTLPRRADHQDPPGVRAAAEAAVPPDHRGPARRQPAVRRDPRPHPGAAGRLRAAAHDARTGSSPIRPTGPGRTAPTCAGGRSRARSRRRSTRSATARTRAGRAAARRLRQGTVQAAPRGRVRDQPPQTQPRRGHPL